MAAGQAWRQSYTKGPEQTLAAQQDVQNQGIATASQKACPLVHQCPEKPQRKIEKVYGRWAGVETKPHYTAEARVMNALPILLI